MAGLELNSGAKRGDGPEGFSYGFPMGFDMVFYCFPHGFLRFSLGVIVLVIA